MLQKQCSQVLIKEVSGEERGKAGELTHLEYCKSNFQARCPLRNYEIELITGKEQTDLVATGINFVLFIIRYYNLYILPILTDFSKKQISSRK